jgi:hypothetical protein
MTPGGGTAYLRLALILIDNVVEVILFHRIGNALKFNDHCKQVLEFDDQKISPGLIVSSWRRLVKNTCQSPSAAISWREVVRRRDVM